MTESKQPSMHFSKIGKPKENDVVGDILALAARPEVISFAGGLPAPEGFPVKEIKAAADWVLDTQGTVALQYSPTQGMKALREVIADYETGRGNECTPDNIVITAGSQQALDILGRVLAEPKAKILVECPTYLGALSAFNLVEPEYVELPTDKEGLNPDLVDEEKIKGAHFAYVMPTFNNPTGLTISVERRKKFIELARRNDFWIVEDNPYGELYYAEKPPVAMRAFGPDRVITLGTMSKILAPGFRLGYIIAPLPIVKAINQIKSAMDLHTSTYTQLVTARVFTKELRTEHLPEVRKIYASHAKVMLESLEKYMPKDKEIYWTKPTGGMFIWLHLPEYVNSADLMKKVLASPVPVGFVPGFAFYAAHPQMNTCRLSFVTVPEEKIIAGIKSIAECLKTMMK